jgi:dethiobiotin synthetase
MKYFITGIGTDVGKTIVASILTEALEADYWKPIQTGAINESDTLIVKKLIQNNKSQFHKEAYHLKSLLSPHAAAYIDGLVIDTKRIKIPETDNILIIEGAGGIMVPINDKTLMIDFMKSLDAEIILVSKNYLGSINHTLLTLKVLEEYNLKIKGIVFNNVGNKLTEDYILKYSGYRCLFSIPYLSNITKNTIHNIAQTIDKSIFQL